MNEAGLIDLLVQLDIGYQRFDHPPVYTVEDANLYLADAVGLGTKNLFLKPEKNAAYLLLVVLEHKRVDLNRLGKDLGLGKLRFGSADMLKDMLGIEPGSVTVLAVVNDVDKRVRVLVDKDLWMGGGLQCHPLTNTATLVIQPADLQKVLAFSGHDMDLIEVPVRPA